MVSLNSFAYAPRLLSGLGDERLADYEHMTSCVNGARIVTVTRGDRSQTGAICETSNWPHEWRLFWCVALAFVACCRTSSRLSSGRTTPAIRRPRTTPRSTRSPPPTSASSQVAWEWKPNEKVLPQFGTRPGAFQNTPLDDRRRDVLSTPYNQVAALERDQRQGAVAIRSEGLRRRPAAQRPGLRASRRRRLARSLDFARATGQLRIFLNARYKLIQLDAKTGVPVAAFGKDGIVDLSEGLVWAINKKHYTNTSPPIVYKDLIIVGNGVGDRLTYKNDPPGDVRAFNARTGKLVWKFNTIPQRGEFGNNTWDAGSWQFTGHTNVWAPMSLDESRAACSTCR